MLNKRPNTYLVFLILLLGALAEDAFAGSRKKPNYQKLREECMRGATHSCCLASVDVMERGGHFLSNPNKHPRNDGCPKGFSRNTLRCMSSYPWCQPDQNSMDTGTKTLQVCPDEWIDNQMPGFNSEGQRQYFIVDGTRRELNEFDLNWIRSNCAIEPQTVY